jgi:hypothetical protein
VVTVIVRRALWAMAFLAAAVGALWTIRVWSVSVAHAGTLLFSGLWPWIVFFAGIALSIRCIVLKPEDRPPMVGLVVLSSYHLVTSLAAVLGLGGSIDPNVLFSPPHLTPSIVSPVMVASWWSAWLAVGLSVALVLLSRRDAKSRG